MPNKTNKLLRMTQKLMEDIRVMRTEHESRIARLEKSTEELKENLRGLVEFSKEAMNSSVEGIKRVNEMIAIQRAQPSSARMLICRSLQDLQPRGEARTGRGADPEKYRAHESS